MVVIPFVVEIISFGVGDCQIRGHGARPSRLLPYDFTLVEHVGDAAFRILALRGGNLRAEAVGPSCASRVTCRARSHERVEYDAVRRAVDVQEPTDEFRRESGAVEVLLGVVVLLCLDVVEYGAVLVPALEHA